MKLRQNGTVFRVLNWLLWQPAGTANRRISNFEGWKRFAKSFLKQTEYIHSTFDVGRSMFDVHQFLFRLDRPFFWPAAGLTPETTNLPSNLMRPYFALNPEPRTLNL
jgi:hypothetical protein